MKQYSLHVWRLLALVSLVLVAVLLMGQNRPQAIYAVKEPPASMDNHYPPKAQAPMFLITMFELEGNVTGIMAALEERDVRKAQSYLAKFKEVWVRIGQMVPEWKGYVPVEPVLELEKALAAGDMKKFQETTGKVFASCAGCHQENRTGVWYKYHWGNFEAIKVKAGNQDVAWVDYMFGLADSIGKAQYHMAEARPAQARQSIETLRGQLTNLRAACTNCHTTERRYFVSDDILGMLSQAAQALAATPPNPQRASEMLNAAGMQSCYNCHLVHQPSAVAKRGWSMSK